MLTWKPFNNINKVPLNQEVSTDRLIFDTLATKMSTVPLKRNDSTRTQKTTTFNTFTNQMWRSPYHPAFIF